jgi:protein-S-isoprenylcysteine O-methyltransferase Ste14
MTNKTKGNIFVAIQFALLALLFFVPGGSDWQVSTEMSLASLLLSAFGFVILIFSAVTLGKSLTANPVPLKNAVLKTNGLYSLVRHPIYFGVILLAVAVVVQSRSWMHLLFGMALFVLFELKARFEESLLLEHYRDYAAYASKVGRLLPLIGRIRK